MTVHFEDAHLLVHVGDARDCLRELPDASVHCVVTSPPYWGLRDYGTAGQLGLEPTPEAYVATMVEVFREVRRVLRDDGTLWLNLGDSYASGEVGRHDRSDGYDGVFSRASTQGKRQSSRLQTGLKPKDLVGIPWRLAFALQADGWYLRSDIIWAKPNPMPESVTDRPTKSHEYLFLLTKSARYYFDAEAVREPVTESSVSRLAQPGLPTQIGSDRVPGKTNGNMEAVGDPSSGRNIRTVWTIATEPYPGAHFATFPRKLVEPCVKAGCPEGGTLLDPFAGSGTTGLVANALGRRAILIDLSADYIDQAMQRNAQAPLGIGA